MRMDERKQKVLAAIVQDYIIGGEPVGSRSIARRYNLGVSPATIRNEMADLEEMGLLEQPHTSAGRIPSDYGYRYYVDCLMAPEELTAAEKEYIQRRYKQKMHEFEQMLEETARLISEMTAYTAVALGPNQKKAYLEQVQILPVQLSGKALLIAVTSTGLVEHRLFTIPDNTTEEDLQRLSKYLNDSLQGKVVEDIHRSILQDLYQEVIDQRELCNQVLEILRQVLALEGSKKIYLEGAFNILSQPEFKDLERVKKLLAFLEKEDALRRVFASTPEKGLSIRIGQENKHEGIDRCTVVTIDYNVEGKVAGKLGLLGPTRMQYSRVISVMNCIADCLSRSLQQFYR
ncbi:MAG: heat-inducible transcription repressor HrcA [Clostridia bacterium]|nr:heat-inducible transcription repressor HrcA [Clostridia bacterium]